MRTTRKQFPVNTLTSGRLAFTIQRPKARRSQQMKKEWRPKWRDDVEGLWVDKLFFLNEKTYPRNWLKLLHTSPLQATVEIG